MLTFSVADDDTSKAFTLIEIVFFRQVPVSPETVEHFFFQCTYSTDFWTKFEHYWLAVTKEQRKLE